MTVNPGFGGQRYISTMEPKIRRGQGDDRGRRSRRPHGHRGGRWDRRRHRRRRGCGRAPTSLVAGSALFRHPGGLGAAVSELRRASPTSAQLALITAAEPMWFDDPRGERDDDPGLPFKLWPCSNGEYLPAPLDELRSEAMRRARARRRRPRPHHGSSRRRVPAVGGGHGGRTRRPRVGAGDRAQATRHRPRRSLRRGAGRRATEPAEAAVAVHGAAAPGRPSSTCRPTSSRTSARSVAASRRPRAARPTPADCFSVDYWYDLVLGRQRHHRGGRSPRYRWSVRPIRCRSRRWSAAGQLADAALRRRPGADPGSRRPRRRSDRRRGRRRWPTSPPHTSSAPGRPTPTSPTGWFLDDHDPARRPVGQRVHRRRARATGVPVIAVHKGLSGGATPTPPRSTSARPRRPIRTSPSSSTTRASRVGTPRPTTARRRRVSTG